VTGPQFRKSREAAGLTIAQASRDFGVNYTTIWRWETDRMPIPKLAADRISQLAQIGDKSSRERKR